VDALDVLGACAVPPLGAEHRGEVGAGGGLLGAQPLAQLTAHLFLGGRCAAHLLLTGAGEHLTHAPTDGDGHSHHALECLVDAV
jgi:hypothetical protein